jgi:predicted O-methyltransferase YrrM
MNEEWHSKITEQLGGKANYGKGVTPNPFIMQNKEQQRRAKTLTLRAEITRKLESLYEPRFITGIETCEFIESLITMTDSRQILEIGTCTGFGTLHILRAIVGKKDAKVVSIDARPAYDKEWFSNPQIAEHCEMIEGWSPEVLGTLKGRVFDVVFIDSDHSVEHTRKEFDALMPITRPGTILLTHDVPEFQTPSHPGKPPVRLWLEEMVRDNRLQGFCLPSCEQLDCVAEYGDGYPKECNPGLGLFVRP